MLWGWGDRKSLTQACDLEVCSDADSGPLSPGLAGARFVLAPRALGVMHGGILPSRAYSVSGSCLTLRLLTSGPPCAPGKGRMLFQRKNWPGVTKACQFEGLESQLLACKMDREVIKLGRTSRSV